MRRLYARSRAHPCIQLAFAVVTPQGNVRADCDVVGGKTIVHHTRNITNTTIITTNEVLGGHCALRDSKRRVFIRSTSHLIGRAQEKNGMHQIFDGQRQKTVLLRVLTAQPLRRRNMK